MSAYPCCVLSKSSTSAPSPQAPPQCSSDARLHLKNAAAPSGWTLGSHTQQDPSHSPLPVGQAERAPASYSVGEPVLSSREESSGSLPGEASCWSEKGSCRAMIRKKDFDTQYTWYSSTKCHDIDSSISTRVMVFLPTSSLPLGPRAPNNGLNTTQPTTAAIIHGGMIAVIPAESR